MSITHDHDSFRTINADGRSLSVQLAPVSIEHALANSDANGVYTSILALSPHFYYDAGDDVSADTLSDILAAKQVQGGLSPYGLAELIVGFDYANSRVLVQISNDVVSAAAELAEDMAALTPPTQTSPRPEGSEPHHGQEHPH